MDTQGSQKQIGAHLRTHENEVGSACCHHSFALSCTYFFKTLVLYAHRFQYRTREKWKCSCWLWLSERACALKNWNEEKCTMDSFCCRKQCCGNCSWPPKSCAHDTMLPLPKHFQASWCLQDFDFSNSDNNCSFIQFLSRVSVVGILHDCKSQRYHSRLWTKGWWRNSFSSNRLKVYQNSYCAPAVCSSTVVLSGRGYSSSGFQDSLWTCSTLLVTS